MRLRLWMTPVLMLSLATMLAPASAGAAPTPNGIVEGAPPQAPEPLAPVPVGTGKWQEFHFYPGGVDSTGCVGECTPSSSGNSVNAPAAPWAITCPTSGCILTVQDAFNKGDQFDVFDNGVKIGSTSAVANSGAQCAGDSTDPAVCALDPGSSRGVFLLGSGQSHSITIRATVVNCCGGGAAYFLLDPGVPIPTLSEWAMVGMAVLLFGFGLWSLRGRIGFGGRPA